MVVVIFDLETSGLNPYHDDIIEIGAKVFQGDNSFQTLLKPKSNRPISKKITEITTITNKQLRDEGKPWKTAYSEFYNWLHDITKDEEQISVVSHNGTTFDFIFLKRMFQELAPSLDESIVKVNLDSFNFIDTLLLSRRILPGRTYYSQPTLAKSYRILIENAHRALGDVIVLEQIYSKLLEEFSIRTKIDGLNEPDKVLDYINLKI